MATVTIDAERWERVSAVVKVFTSADHEGIACDFHGKGAIRLGKAFEEAVDAVRLHPGDLEPVAPVAPDPGLREAIAKAIYNADVSSCDCDCSDCIHQAAVDADAVLAVLAERGVR